MFLTASMMNPRSLALVFSLFALTARGAEAPAEFAGIKWGASQAEARTAMIGRGAEPRKSDPTRMNFAGGDYNGQRALDFSLAFPTGGFQGGQVRLPAGRRAEASFRKLKSELNDKYGTASDSQVGHRRPGHFVLGLGWRMSGATAPKLSAEWELTSGLKPSRTVAIQLWVERGALHLAYANETMKENAAPTRPAKGKEL